MPRYNVDRDATLHDPVAFVMGGKEYIVRELDRETAKEVQQIFDDLREEEDVSIEDLNSALDNQLSAFTGNASEDFAEFTYREKKGAVDWIMDVLANPRGGNTRKGGRKG